MQKTLLDMKGEEYKIWHDGSIQVDPTVQG